MQRIILLLSLFSSVTVHAQANINVIKSCFVELGCAYLKTNLQTGRETINLPKAMFDNVTSEMKTQLSAAGYNLSLVTPRSAKFLETLAVSAVPTQTVIEAEGAVAKSGHDSFVATSMCAFSGMACGLSFVAPINWIAIIPACGSGLVACYDSVIKMKDWWTAKEKYHQLKKREMEAKEAEAAVSGAGAGSDPSVIPDVARGGPGFGDAILSPPHEPKLPEGRVISIDCPDGGC